MKTRCVVIDDEPLAIELIENHIAQLEHLEVVGTFKNVLQAFDFIKRQPIDLLFLDIQMPMLNGIDFLRSASIVPKVILTTAYREYALEGYELNVVDYLLKPITFERFLKAVDKYYVLQTSRSPQTFAEDTGIMEKNFIYVKADKKHIKLSFDDILYIESMKDYIKIRTSQETIIVKEKISEFQKLLPEHRFIRVHRSYLVNTNKITAYTQYDVEINNLEIPIGGMYKQNVLNLLGR